MLMTAIDSIDRLQQSLGSRAGQATKAALSTVGADALSHRESQRKLVEGLLWDVTDSEHNMGVSTTSSSTTMSEQQLNELMSATVFRFVRLLCNGEYGLV
jgi:hypothetical protein